MGARRIYSCALKSGDVIWGTHRLSATLCTRNLLILIDNKTPTIMLRRALIYFLTTLIALQSVMVIADAHQLHQSGEDHLSFNHDHAVDDGSMIAVESDKRLDALIGAVGHDCHHCCHCHGVSAAFLAGSALHVFVESAVNFLPSYRFSYASIHNSPDNPPPI